MKRSLFILFLLVSALVFFSETVEATYLRAPTDFKMTYATTIDSLVATVIPPWQAPALDSMYVANASDTSQVANFADSLATELRIGGLTADTDYTWIAVADSQGVRVVSNDFTLRTPAQETAEFSLTSTNTTITMSINNLVFALGDSLRVLNVADSSLVIKIDPYTIGRPIVQTLNNLTPATTYNLYVASYYGAGPTILYSTPVTIDTKQAMLENKPDDNAKTLRTQILNELSWTWADVDTIAIADSTVAGLSMVYYADWNNISINFTASGHADSTKFRLYYEFGSYTVDGGFVTAFKDSVDISAPGQYLKEILETDSIASTYFRLSTLGLADNNSASKMEDIFAVRRRY